MAGRERHFWRALYDLRAAEAMADIGRVSGSADAPPKSLEEESAWVDDWVSRAKEAWSRAKHVAEAGAGATKDGARTIVKTLQRGAASVWEATAGRARKKLQPLIDDWNKFQFGVMGSSLIASIVIVWIGWKLWTAKRA